MTRKLQTSGPLNIDLSVLMGFAKIIVDGKRLTLVDRS
jgi:hypothetical protein